MSTLRNCGTCKYWKFYILNQIWGTCLKILYCNDANADNLDLANVTYTYCEGEDLDKAALDHKLALDTAREFGCCLWEEKS